MSDDRPADQPPPAPRRKGLDGRTIGGRYRVLRTVAAGANTLIADAHDIELDRTVTIKLVRPELSESEEFRRSFRKQMEQMAAISHPNIAAVYDWGEEQIGQRSTVYVVVEYLSGGSLRDLFDRGRNLTPSQALMVGLEACRGLDFAHRKGLVHTELTPSKLVFGDDRRLRIVDFGLARILGEPDWKEPCRLATHVARYASPEQAQGKPLDGKTDVYSLALILVEAVTGQRPFVGESTVATLSARIGKLMPVSADLGPLAAVLERAGRPEAAERSSASQFGRALVRAAEQAAPADADPDPRSERLRGPGDDAAPDDPTGRDRPPAGRARAGARHRSATPARRPTRPTRSAARRKAISNLTVPPPTVPPPDRCAGGRSRAPMPQLPASAPQRLCAATRAWPSAAQPPSPADAPPAPARRGCRSRAAGEVRRAGRDAEPAGSQEGSQGPAEGGQGRRTSGPPRPPRHGPANGRGARRRQFLPAPAVEAPPPQPKRRRWVPWLVGLFLLGVLGGLGYLAWVLFRTPTHEVPAVVGLPRDEALALVDDFDWEITVDDDRSDEYRTPGQVI